MNVEIFSLLSCDFDDGCGEDDEDDYYNYTGCGCGYEYGKKHGNGGMLGRTYTMPF